MSRIVFLLGSLQQFSCAYGGYRGDETSTRQCIARKADLMVISNHDRVGKALELELLKPWPDTVTRPRDVAK